MTSSNDNRVVPYVKHIHREIDSDDENKPFCIGCAMRGMGRRNFILTKSQQDVMSFSLFLYFWKSNLMNFYTAQVCLNVHYVFISVYF